MKIQFQELSKEQKQIAVLSVLLAIGISYATYRFALVPSLGAMRKAREELGEMESQLRKAERLIARRERIVEDLEESSDRLGQWVEKYVAPQENRLAWATEYIYRIGREVGIDIEAASEVAVGLVPWQSAPETKRIFDPYATRIVFRGSFFDLVQFLEKVEKTNPFAIVSLVNIAAYPTDPEHHNIEVRLVFPTWAEERGPRDIRSPPKGVLQQVDAGSGA
ncbi:MAG TPA: hypothetical protein EYP62_02150 [Kiritimatiellae bacterium]|nr:hypothetical protein [Kiritimatiellia bacterium]